MSLPSTLLAATATEADRLDRALARAFPEVSRSRFQALIADGAVSVEGATVREPRHKVKPGYTLGVVVPRGNPWRPNRWRKPCPESPMRTRT